MNIKSIMTRVLVVLLCILLLGGAVYALDVVPRVEIVTMEMQAYELAEDGSILGTHSLKIQGKLLHYRTKSVRLDAKIESSDNYRYIVSAPDGGFIQSIPWLDQMNIFYTTAFIVDRFDGGISFASFAFDIENGCAILRPRKSSDTPGAERPYLLASTDPDLTPEAIFEFFLWFPKYS